MATRTVAPTATPANRVAVQVVLYYIALGVIGALAWRYLPRTHVITDASLDALFGTGPEVIRTAGKNAAVPEVGQGTLAATVALAMIASAALSLPVAWVYTLTRSRRGYQQSVVQLLIVLPVIVSGIVALVKYSLPLAFSLGGIAAAVRFRNTLDDSKDAAYIFLMMGLGIASAVDLPVAAVISVVFNVLIFALWTADFGRTPVALDGKLAERRLQRARDLSRTGTFVARIEDEVMSEMTSEQLEGIAERAWRRAREHSPEGEERGADRVECRIRVRITEPMLTQPVLEARLDDAAKKWELAALSDTSDGTTVIDYVVMPKKKSGPDELLALLRVAGGRNMIEAELL
jgi:Domain of unknown function (DUF4956)